MPNRVLQLRKILTRISNEYVDRQFMQWMTLYQCHHVQRIKAIPFRQPTLLLVVEGRKAITLNDKKWSITSGDIFVVPADTTLWLENIPNKPGNNYLGLAVNFSMETLHLFNQIYGSGVDAWAKSTIWHVTAPDSIITALLQWLELCQVHSVEKKIAQHRQLELLLLLAQAGYAGNILVNQHSSWRQRVSHFLSMDMAKAWKIDDICKNLNISESSLRRRLQEEQSSFRELLEETRLTTGLSRLLETQWSIARIADSVGYQSQSRFGERFKHRFGLTPSELKRTRMTDKREILKVNGE